MAKVAGLPTCEDGFARKKWNVAECRALFDSGLLEYGRYELVGSEILSRRQIGRLHVTSVMCIYAALDAVYKTPCIQLHGEIGIGEVDTYNDPVADVAVVRGLLHDYSEREPNPATDILLVVEAALQTLPGDSAIKMQIYARHGIREYWIVAIARRELIVHRQPTPNGYADVQVYSENEAVAPLSAPDSPVQVSALMP